MSEKPKRKGLFRKNKAKMTRAEGAKFARAWLAALRSGTYPQAGSRLHTLPSPEEEGGFCCLGVALDVMYGEAAWDDYGDMPYPALDCEDHALPDNSPAFHAFLDLYGIGTADGDIELPAVEGDMGYPRETILVSTLNDYGGTFPEIADRLEAYLREHGVDL